MSNSRAKAASRYRSQRRRPLPPRRLRSSGAGFLGSPAMLVVTPSYVHYVVRAGRPRQYLVQAIDQDRSVLVQEVHEAERAFLRLAIGERLRSSMVELSAQRL